MGNYKTRVNTTQRNDIIVNSLRLWVKYVGAFRNVKSTRYIYISVMSIIGIVIGLGSVAYHHWRVL